MFSSEEKEYLSYLLDAIGVRNPADAIEKLDLLPQLQMLLELDVPAKVAERVLLVTYGKALKAGGTTILKGLRGILGAATGKAPGTSFP